MLSSGTIDEYEYMTGEKILPFNQRKTIEQTTFAYSSLWKALEKQKKKIEFNGEKKYKKLKIIKNNWIRKKYIFKERRIFKDILTTKDLIK